MSNRQLTAGTDTVRHAQAADRLDCRRPSLARRAGQQSCRDCAADSPTGEVQPAQGQYDDLPCIPRSRSLQGRHRGAAAARDRGNRHAIPLDKVCDRAVVVSTIHGIAFGGVATEEFTEPARRVFETVLRRCSRDGLPRGGKALRTSPALIKGIEGESPMPPPTVANTTVQWPPRLR
jgi:hypothetical protein